MAVMNRHALVHQVFSVEDWERCKFTSKAFADAAVSSLDLIAAANPGGDDPEPSFDWVRASVTNFLLHMSYPSTALACDALRSMYRLPRLCRLQSNQSHAD